MLENGLLMIKISQERARNKTVFVKKCISSLNPNRDYAETELETTVLSFSKHVMLLSNIPIKNRGLNNYHSQDYDRNSLFDLQTYPD